MSTTPNQNGRDYLAVLDTERKALHRIEIPFIAVSQVRCAGDHVVFIGASTTESTAIVSLNLITNNLEMLRRSQYGNEQGYIPRRPPLADLFASLGN
jgi:hypothetical protein